MTPAPPFDAAAFEQALLADIPLARAMHVRVSAHDGDELALAAPLPPNINDKGCAFGGSLVSLLTLAGWGLIVLKLAALGRDCDVFVQDSSVHYLAPVWTDITAVARLAAGQSWSAFADTLATRGRARLRVTCRVALADGSDACTLAARFVAIVRNS
ncbi:MAG: YiiD C-terminal domain-containing protein [Rudaea sp.]|nr:YiiD C-terminal domain-containing protein [Rudaea sp.]